jgi:signal transduction histidine kinase
VPRLSLRVLLLAGFTGIFLLWLFSAYALVQRMIEADNRGAAIRSRFLSNERALSTVRVQTLLSSVYLRDALLDATPAGVSPYQDELHRIRRGVEQTLTEYEPRVESAAERAEWLLLQTELRDYWDSMLPVLALERTPGPAEARSVLREKIIPRRETIIRVSDRIHAVNQRDFEREQAELATLRQGLRSRVWQTSTVTVVLGLAIAVLATVYAGRLESRVREQHAHELQHKSELERLSSKLMQAQEDEQRRIARELHDEIGQALSAIKLELAIAERSTAGEARTAALIEARGIADRVLQSVRDLSQLLHPAMLDHLGLADTATSYLRAFSRRTGIASELTVEELESRLAPEIEVCTYRVIQEAVVNVAKHAAATTCRVRIQRLRESLHVSVEDDGKGFNLAEARASLPGLGLVSLRERVTRLGGQLRIESELGQGTRLMADLPLSGFRRLP